MLQKIESQELLGLCYFRGGPMLKKIEFQPLGLCHLKGKRNCDFDGGPVKISTLYHLG